MVAEYKDHSYYEQRRDQATQLMDFVKVFSQRMPTILGGDFNMGPSLQGRDNYLNVDKLWNELRPTLLKDLKMAPLDYGNLTTYTGANSNKPGCETHDCDEGVIDHLFGYNGAVPVSAKIVFKNKFKVNNISTGERYQLPYSDHFGMQAIFTIE